MQLIVAFEEPSLGEPTASDVTHDRDEPSAETVRFPEISKIAERYGGGGHRNAAGFSVHLRTWLKMLHR